MQPNWTRDSRNPIAPIPAQFGTASLNPQSPFPVLPIQQPPTWLTGGVIHGDAVAYCANCGAFHGPDVHANLVPDKYLDPHGLYKHPCLYAWGNFINAVQNAMAAVKAQAVFDITGKGTAPDWGAVANEFYGGIDALATHFVDLPQGGEGTIDVPPCPVVFSPGAKGLIHDLRKSFDWKTNAERDVKARLIDALRIMLAAETSR